MWASGSSSEPRRRLRALIVAALAATSAAPVCAADVAADDALRSTFPGAGRFERETAFLTDSQSERVAALSGVAIQSRIVTYFTAHRDEEGEGSGSALLGAAFIDTHLVRTKPETLLISIEPPGKIRGVEVLSFLEPPEYRVSERWLRQLVERPLDDELRLRRAIRTLSGATLSSRSATDASRRALALYEVLVSSSGDDE